MAGGATKGQVVIKQSNTSDNDLGCVNINGNWLGIPNASSDPAPVLTPLPTGAMYFNTGDNTLRIWNGSAWKQVTLT